LQPMTGCTSSMSSYASFPTPSVVHSDNAFKSSTNVQNVGLRMSSVIPSSVAISSPAANVSFQSSVNARFVPPPPTHLPPPSMHIAPPPPLTFNPQLPPPPFNPLMPPPLPPPLLSSTMPTQPSTSNVSQFTLPTSFDFHVPPPSSVNAGFIHQARYGGSVQNEQVRLPVPSSGQSVGIGIQPWPGAQVHPATVATALQNQFGVVPASSHQSSAGVLVVQNATFSGQRSFKDTQFKQPVVPAGGTITSAASVQVLEQNADVAWINNFVLNARQRSSFRVSDKKHELMASILLVNLLCICFC
jgi:hypothetical protein